MFDSNLNLQLQNRDLKERMRIIKLMSEDKNNDKKRTPEKTIEKLYHCDDHEDEG